MASMVSAQTAYWTESWGYPSTSAILSQALSGGPVSTLWTSATRISDVTADPANSRLFWTEGSDVFMGNANGTGARSLIHSHTDWVQRVDYVDDGTDQWVYWSCPPEQKLGRTKLSNFASTVIALNYHAFAIDRRPGKLHLYTVNNGQLVRSNLAGGSQAVLATLASGDAPLSMVVDEAWECLWMLGRHFGKTQPDTFWIKRVALSNGAITTRISSSGTPVLQQGNWQDIAVDCVNGNIVWSAMRDDIKWRLYSAPRASGGEAEIRVAQSNGATEGVFVDPEGVCPSSNPPKSNPFGLGCYLDAASAYQMVPPSILAFGIRFVLAGGNYVVDGASGSAFVPPTGASTSLTLTDDSVALITLPSPMPIPGGTTSVLEVCSNGFISPVGTNGVGYTPNPAAFLSALPRWACWSDFAPTPANNVVYEFVGGSLYVTWDGVPTYGAPATGSTFQFQFDMMTGVVDIVGAGMNTNSDFLVGWSTGGGALDGGSRDILSGLPIVLPVSDVPPLGLIALTEPAIGSTFVLDTIQTPNPLLGFCYLSSGRLPGPGLDLAILGAPGCNAMIDLGQVFASQILFGGATTLVLPVPADPFLTGVTFYAQSAWFEPAANAFGIQTSNGIELTIQ